MSETLFDKYGGVPTVTRIVKDFHERLMRRPNVRRYFLGMPVDKVIQHHIEYVSYAMGKPNSRFTTDQLHASHLPVGVTKASYVLILDLFVAALQEEKVSEEDIATIAGNLMALADDIVTRGIEK